ncbi:hypothetical protein JXA32_04870 [Candidatus Sumerlaeota bacterium]|nr:hypothetical protein [Candidatus Sumerlaeota bacterium]
MNLRIEACEVFGFPGPNSAGAGYLLFSFIFDKALNIVDVAQWLAWLTPFHYADPTKVFSTGAINWADNCILIASVIVILLGTLALFLRKDIAS